MRKILNIKLNTKKLLDYTNVMRLFVTVAWLTSLVCTELPIGVKHMAVTSSHRQHIDMTIITMDIYFNTDFNNHGRYRSTRRQNTTVYYQRIYCRFCHRTRRGCIETGADMQDFLDCDKWTSEIGITSYFFMFISVSCCINTMSISDWESGSCRSIWVTFIHVLVRLASQVSYLHTLLVCLESSSINDIMITLRPCACQTEWRKCRSKME